MALVEDDRPRDSLGRPARRKRYPVPYPVKISEQALADLQEMAADRSSKVGTIMRRAVMKEIYIWKHKKEKKT